MILEQDSNQDINTALFLMASLSPKVKESIDLELYKQTADSDGSTDQYILDDAFLNFIRDIETIGLSLSFDYSDLTEDMSKLFKFLKFTSYLLPNSLYDILKTDIKIRECVDHILSGSLGEDNTLIQVYLSELGGLDGQDPLVPELTETLDEYYPIISQTEIFTDYIKTIHGLVLSERLIVESDHQTHEIFRNKARDLIGRFSDAVNVFSDQAIYDQLCTFQNWFIKDLTAPVNFIDYNYIFGVDKNTLPEDLVEGHTQKRYHYEVSHLWCMAYYQVRKLEVFEVHKTIMSCFFYACCETKSEYLQKKDSLNKTYPLSESNDPIILLYQE